jgi:putative Mg2+ transporter-C (MgtC) family protein
VTFPSLVAASVPTIGWGEVTLRLFVAAVLGGAIGFERELRERQAGLRTHLLVSVGSALFTLVSAYGFTSFMGSPLVARIDPTRIAAQIVTGIGFLGAGAIIRQGLSIRGLTTAATLWLVAAIGMAAGAGWWSAAVITTAGAVLTLGPLRGMAYRVLVRIRPQHERLLVEIPAGGSAAPIIDAIEREGGRVVSLDVTQEGERRSVGVSIELPSASAPAVVAGVAEIDGVLEVRWME